MSGSPARAPAWLGPFQEQFTAMLRTPLARDAGHLAAVMSDYAGELVVRVRAEDARGGRARLAVYNRQYWFRLFGVMQHQFPLAAALLGAWTFNRVAGDFLVAVPPRGHDLADCGVGFDRYTDACVEEEIRVGYGRPALPKRVLLDAIRIDAAFRAVFVAGPSAPLRPDRARAIGASSRLRAASGMVIVEECCPLLAMRRDAIETFREAPVASPPLYPDGRRHWAIQARRDGPHVVPLARQEAELLRWLASRRVADALAMIESGCAPHEQAQLPAQVQQWLARSIKLGFWSSVDEGEV